MQLTDRKIKALKPRAQRYEVWDGGGLGLRVATTGLKTWVYTYQFRHRSRRLQLGVYPMLSLAAARQALAEARLLVTQGVDPAQRRCVVQQLQREAPTVAELIAQFGERYGQAHRSNWRNEYGMLQRDVLPVLGAIKAKDLHRREVILLLEQVAKRAPVVANRLKSLLVTICNWAVDKGLLDDNPLLGIKPPAKERPRERVLNESEIVRFWRKLSDCSMGFETQMALKLTLALGQRSGEVVALEWSEIDWTDAIWTIPREKTKPKLAAHLVPLPALAVEILRELQALNGRERWVFSSYSRTEGKAASVHLTQRALGRALKRNLAVFGFEQPCTPHDLRRTVRSQLGQLQVPPHIAERVIGHQVGRLEQTYDRYNYLKEKREALATWNGKLQQLVNVHDAAAA